MTKELKQICDINASIPLRAEELSIEEKKRAMTSLVFLVEKREMINARQGTDGRKHRGYISKDSLALPMVSNKAIFIM